MNKKRQTDVKKNPLPSWLGKNVKSKSKTRTLIAKKLVRYFPQETVPIAHLVILVPGALSSGAWADTYVEVGLKGIAFKPVKHFRTPSRDDLEKGDPSDFSEHIAEISDVLIRAHPHSKVSFIAHSFGTHVLCDMFERQLIAATKKVFSIVLMGSIVSRRKAVVLRNACELLINECGTNDFVVPVIEAIWPRHYSATGHFGFGTGLCYDRFFGYGHSDATKKAHFNAYLKDIFTADGSIRVAIKKGTKIKPWLPALTPKILRELGALKSFL